MAKPKSLVNKIESKPKKTRQGQSVRSKMSPGKKRTRGQGKG